MANAETTFADRLGRGNLLKSICEALDPAFAPADAENTPAVFQVLLDSCQTKNTAVENARTLYSTGAVERRVLVKNFKTISGRTLTNCESVKAYKPFAKTVRQVVRRISNYKLPKKDKPQDPNKKKRNRGTQSYAELENLFRLLFDTLTGIPGYTHTEPTLQLPQIEIAFNDYKAKNTAMTAKEAAVNLRVKERFDVYNNKETGLRDRMKEIKKAVRNQYGTHSTQYLSVSGIKL